MKIAFALAAFLAVGPTIADEMQPPFLKDGLWQNTGSRVVAGKTIPTTTKVCENREVQQQSREMAATLRQRFQCTIQISHPSRSVYVMENHCAAGPNPGSVSKTTETHGADTYKLEQHRVVGSQDSVVMVIEGKYLGACPADMKPGDTITSDGTKMNALQQ